MSEDVNESPQLCVEKSRVRQGGERDTERRRGAPILVAKLRRHMERHRCGEASAACQTKDSRGRQIAAERRLPGEAGRRGTLQIKDQPWKHSGEQLRLRTSDKERQSFAPVMGGSRVQVALPGTPTYIVPDTEQAPGHCAALTAPTQSTKQDLLQPDEVGAKLGRLLVHPVCLRQEPAYQRYQ